MNKTLYFYIRNYGSFIIPKKKSFYVFMPTLSKNKFTGNAKALQVYINKEHKDIRNILISKYPEVLEDAQKNQNLKTTTPFSIKGLWSVLRAQYIIVDASYSGDFDQGSFHLIQLWHGSGYKNVGLVYEGNASKANGLKRIYSKYRLVITTSESDAKKRNLAFNTDASVVTGYPRNDIFFKSNKSLSKRLKERYQLKKYNEIILYAPTHRDSIFESIEVFSKDFWERIQKYLEENNSLLIVKRHPKDESLKIPDQYKNIKDWTDKVSDIQEFLLIADLLITDYSSITTDFALTDRPILIYAYDLDKYVKQVRSMYYNLEKTLPQPILKTEDELLEKIKNRDWQEDPEIKKSYVKFKNTFHKYLDGNSCQRVTEEILKLEEGKNNSK